jgi:membrane-bound lytic murein transglycosylase D
LAAGLVFLASCATTSGPQQFRTPFLPPAVAKAAVVQQPIAEAPPEVAFFYANELPSSSVSFPSVSLPILARPSDAEFLIKRADVRYAAGKKALQDGRLDDARNEFNAAIEILLTAPEETPEHARLEQRLQELVDAISRYDADELGSGEPLDQVAHDTRPLDEILDMTFPVDPSLRNKVRAQIQATASQLPLEESDAVLSLVNYFTSTRVGKNTLILGIRRSGRYKAMIERVLAEEGLPQELIFLAQAESGFTPHAVSSKLCVGVWQFLRSRGEEYGLEVTASTDARMDPERATRAAAKHLHDLYMHLGDWYLAMAAYNCGPLCIDNAVARTGYADFWALRRLNVLPKETANYVPAILAMIIVAKNAKDYGLDDIVLDPPLEYDTVELESATQLELAAAAVDRPLSELRDLNPALLKSLAPAGYRLHVPKGTLDQLHAAFAVIPASRRDSWRIHRVEIGDTVASLAKRYASSADLIRSANHDEIPEPGQFAAIPVAYAPARTPVKRAPVSSAKSKVPIKPASTKPVQKVAAQKKPVARKPATVAQKVAFKSAPHHTPGA